MQISYETDVYDYDEVDNPESETETHDDSFSPEISGAQRVARLALILLLLLLVSALFFFLILPFIQSITQAPPPALAPAIQI